MRNFIKQEFFKFGLFGFVAIIAISAIGIYFLVGRDLSKTVEAGSSDNVSGFAWSENIGWFSFNNTSGGGAVSYGVNIDLQNGIFSGFAWSENIGWLSFNEADLTGCPRPPCRAKLNSGNGEVSGWAKVLSDASWLRLRGSNYGVSWSSLTQELEGWAWSDSNLGWLSFNCKNQNICSVSNYKVLASLSSNQPPAEPGTSEAWNHCSIQELSVPTFSWTYSDPDQDSQASYHIKIYGITTLDEQVDSSATNYTPTFQWIRDNLAWAGNYSWQVKVKDSQGNWSAWSDLDSFSLPAHSYPWINFAWAPSLPTVNERVQFANQTTYYGGSLGASWSWDFNNDGGNDSLIQNPSYSYPAGGNYTVKFGSCDNTLPSNGGPYCCGAPNAPFSQKNINISLPLPGWKEVAP